MGALGYEAALERRVVPEDQHQDGRQEQKERDDQEAGSEAACRVLQVAHRVGCGEAGEVADRIDQGDAAGAGDRPTAAAPGWIAAFERWLSHPLAPGDPDQSREWTVHPSGSRGCR
jgi:hypothetical protein